MRINNLNDYINEHFDLYVNTSFVIAAILGLIACLYMRNCWWFFPPFIGILLISILFNLFLYKFSK